MARDASGRNVIRPPSFYLRDTLLVARELLGGVLCRRTEAGVVRCRIVETEAYCGPDDKASHASRGRTPRNEVMFGPPGMTYVYFVYGMHSMLNVVTEAEGYPAAVLLRAVEPLDADPGEKPCTHGPARLTKVLGIDCSLNNVPVYNKKNGLWIESGPPVPDEAVVQAARIGVDYAGEYKDKPWRFYIKGNRCVSRK